ncbi:MAG TPA: SurA N-terminal domain-containing protein [Aestuariivirgaceae bacterium]|nr:SurA N-terminal domain-containing protein [Aestuariivirgaceae bacterium]
MMESLRGAATGWVAKVLIGLLALSFAVWGINDVFRGYRSDVLASVGDFQISSENFRRTFEQQLRRVSRQSGQSITAQRAAELGLDRQILGEMLRDGALQQQASRLKLAVPDALVAQEIAKNPAFQNTRGDFDANRFRQILQQNGLNEQMFLLEERGQKLRQAAAEPVIAQLRSPDTLVTAILRHANEQRDARYFVLNANESEVPVPTEAELKTFYEAHPQLFTAPAYRSLTLLKLEPQDLSPAISVSEEDLAKAYEAHRADYGTPEKRTIQQLTFATLEEAKAAKQRINQGTDFLTLAQEKGLQEKDITLGDRSRGEIPDKAIADTAFALAPGTVSEPVQGRLAVALLRVTKVTPATERPLSEVRADILEKLKLERARDQILDLHAKVEDERAGGAGFDEIGKSLKIPLINIPAVDAQGRDKAGKPIEGIPAKSEVLKLAFESDVGVEADPISTETEGLVWVDIRDAVAATVRPFTEVKADVQNALIARKLREQVLKKASDLVKRAEGGTPLETLAQEVGTEVKMESGLKRNETTANFDSAAVSALFLAADNGFVYAPDASGRSAKIIQALPLKQPTLDSKSKEAEAVRKALNEGLQNDLLATYVSSIQKSLGVSVNDQLWRQTMGVGP